tara:strand:- start:89 stop:397 length:309 start_codon:yes stop_codon:yes gene_type:complete
MITALGLEKLGFVNLEDFVLEQIDDSTINIIKWNSDKEIPAESDIIAAHNLAQQEFDSRQYQRDRVYLSVKDQLDQQYWDLINGTSVWKDAISKVKSDNPKP